MRIAVRLFALCLVAAALMPRGVAQHDRVLVLALDGASLARIRELADAGKLPTFAGLLSGAVVAGIYGGDSRDRPVYWRTVFTGLARHEVVSGKGRHLWDAVGSGRVIVVGIRGAEAEQSDRRVVLPGADGAEAFLGDSTGEVVDLESLRNERPDWPYDAAAVQVTEFAHALSSGESSPWLGLPRINEDSGAFRIYVLDESTAYLSPVYLSAIDGGSYLPEVEDLLYVADDPAWTVASPRLRDYYYRHARDVSGGRAKLATLLARGDWRLLVYMDTLLMSSFYVYQYDPAAPRASDEGTIASELVTAYEEVDRRLAALIDAAGAGTAVVVLGSEPLPPAVADRAGRRRGVPTGFMLISGTDGERAGARAEVESIAPTLLYLVGSSSAGASGGDALHLVRARYWLATEQPAESQPVRREEPALPLTAASLESLGLLSAQAKAPADADVREHGLEPEGLTSAQVPGD